MTELVLTSDPAKDTATTKTIEWTPPPGAQGYVFIRNADGKRLSSTLDGQRDFVKVAKANLPVTVRAFRTDSEGVWPPPVVDPPPPGNWALVPPGEMPGVIRAAAVGAKLSAVGGAHPKLTLDVSKAVTITTDPNSYFQGVDTNGQSDYTFDAITSILPVETVDYNISPFYLHGASQRIRLINGFRLSGGYDAIKVYGGCKDCVIDDHGLASSLSGYGGDGIHINGATNLRIPAIHINAPWQLGATPEHNDGIHAQTFDGLYIGPGVYITALGPRSDVDSAGMFINGEPSGSARNLTIEGTQIHWQLGRGCQILGVDGTTKLINPLVYDSGLPSSPKWTLECKNANQRFETWGIPEADLYFQGGLARAQTVVHP